MIPCSLFCFALAVVTLALPTSLPAGDTKNDSTAFPNGDPAKLGVDMPALEKLKAKAESEGSAAVLIVKDGRLIADWDFGKKRGPIQAMSATKSIVNLAIGKLIEQGKIKSLDQPVSDFYPEWKQGRKRLITVRHLLNHTSGLEDKKISGEIGASPDFIQFALAADTVAEPGARFFYSNKATNLLSGLVHKASGLPLDEFIKREIFAPLEISDFTWDKDDAGNPQGMAGLAITAVDLAKIGQLMLDEGVWRGRQVVRREWVSQSIAQGQPHDCTCGLLWWRTPEKTKFTIDDGFIAEVKKQFDLTEPSVRNLRAQKGKLFERFDLWPAIFQIFRVDPNTKGKLEEIEAQIRKNAPVPSEVGVGPMVAFSARGYLGQYLVVVPGHRIVAVRQRRKTENHDPYDYRGEFGDFEMKVRALVK